MPTGFWKFTGTGRRLLFAFVVLIAYFSLASSIALVGFTYVRQAFARASANAEGLRLALELSSAVRDQYAHQAHTIILGTQEHVPLYRKSHDHVFATVAALEMHSRAPEERKLVAEIANTSRQLDALFLQRLIPAVVGNDRAAIESLHLQALSLVTAIESATGSLAHSYERSIQRDRRYAAEIERRVFVTSVIFLLAAPFLAVLVGVFVGRAVTKPVNILREGADRLARGDMNTRIDIETRDEFGALAKQFNAMTAALRRHQRDLIESERLASVGRLAAGVAHEINNPLGVILGYVRILKKQANGAISDDLAIIEEETLRCKVIVEGLLDLSRTPKIDPVALRLRELVDDIVDRIADTANTEVSITVNGDAELEADRVRLSQVLFNLIKNAVEAAAPRGQVQIEIGLAGDGFIEVAVADNGQGVDPAVAAQIFEPFVTTKREGSGLGLPVCRSIAQAHGGDIQFSTGSAGSRFTLRLPARLMGDRV